MVKNSIEISRFNRPGCRVLCFAVGTSNELATFIPATCNQNTLSLWPMIATGIFVDFWCTPKFTSGHHEGAFQQPPIGKILDENANGPIVPYHFTIQSTFDIAMIIPVAGIEGYKTNACLNKTASQKRLLAPTRSIFFPQLHIFFI